ncbi:hypothetical protein ANAEL_05198 [Anaerolineales bacterium]|nr:hypothetical protein ANAEL_05198 [Anaerolineales bacterium]
MRTAGSLDGLLRCSEHDCPMLRIGNQYECVIERVDAHLGGKRVKDILPDSQGTPFALIFEDGHTLPLLCPDCGRSLHVSHQNEDQVLNEVAGLYLVGLAYVETGEEPSGLALLFSRDPHANLENPVTATQEIVLHLDSARRLTCPDERTQFTRSTRNARPKKRGSRKIHR